MKFSKPKFSLVCPLCKDSLILIINSYAKGQDKCHCISCNSNFPMYYGIIDFMDTNMSGSRKLGSGLGELINEYSRVDFEKLMHLYFESYKQPQDLQEIQQNYIRMGKKRGKVRFQKIQNLLEALGKSSKRGLLALDLGCGLGSGLFPLSETFEHAIGIDIVLPYLILAKKRLDEESIHNVTLIRSSAENLPFEDNTFDFINATDVIEHIPDQRKFISEAYRVLRPGGYFCFNSPNRFSIFTREPHVNLWGLGFLPRSLMPVYVKTRKGVGYKGKRLLSYLELARILRTVCRSYQIFGLVKMDTSSGNRVKNIVQKSTFLIWILNSYFKFLLPQYEVVVMKE